MNMAKTTLRKKSIKNEEKGKKKRERRKINQVKVNDDGKEGRTQNKISKSSAEKKFI